MTITFKTVTDNDLATLNARYADLGFAHSQAGELIVDTTVAGDTAGEGGVMSTDARIGEPDCIASCLNCQGHGIVKRIVDFLICKIKSLVLYCFSPAELEGFYRAMEFVEGTTSTHRQLNLNHFSSTDPKWKERRQPVQPLLMLA